jgi:predicted amidophosphoribosyltransferase
MATDKCSHCGYAIPLAAERCPHCTLPGIFPNVRAAQRTEEKEGLDKRYKKSMQREFNWVCPY